MYQFARERTSTLPDRRQCAEILNNLACMNYILNDYKEAFAALSQSLDIQLSLSDDALYLGSKFSSQSSAMNVAVVRANVGFLALVARDIPTARIAFESSLKVRLNMMRCLCILYFYQPNDLICPDPSTTFARCPCKFGICHGTFGHHSSF